MNLFVAYFDLKWTSNWKLNSYMTTFIKVWVWWFELNNFTGETPETLPIQPEDLEMDKETPSAGPMNGSSITCLSRVMLFLIHHFLKSKMFSWGILQIHWCRRSRGILVWRGLQWPHTVLTDLLPAWSAQRSPEKKTKPRLFALQASLGFFT